MKHLDAPFAVALGAAILVAVNAVVLGEAWWNRSGDPEARLELTERELTLPLSREKDDTGLVLTLVLAHQPPSAVSRRARLANRELPPFTLAWLNAAKLRGLGFDLAALEQAARDPQHGGQGRVARRAFVALEYGGDAWRAWLDARASEVARLRDDVEHALADRARLVEAEALLAIDRTSRSRLVPMDAALEPAALRSKYPNRQVYAVVSAIVGVRATLKEGGTVEFSGTIERLTMEGISVPRRWLALFEPFVPRATTLELTRRLREDAAAGRWPAATAPRYRATVSYGRRLDPWLEGVGHLDPATSR